MKEIQSRANPLFRQWLRDKAHAGRPGHLVWLEGPHLCQSWLQNQLEVKWLLIDQTRFDHPEVVQIRNQIDPANWVVISTSLFDALSDVKSHQGVTLLADLPAREIPVDIHGSAVVLDGIQDPGNVGTLLRTCAAAGIQTVIANAGTAGCWSPKVLRSAQGAHAGLHIHETRDASDWLRAYRENASSLPVIATTLEEATSLFSMRLPARAIWIFGSEGQGVSSEMLSLADHRVRIDHNQQYVESLNVATAAALCLFEQARQHRTGR